MSKWKVLKMREPILVVVLGKKVECITVNGSSEGIPDPTTWRDLEQWVSDQYEFVTLEKESRVIFWPASSDGLAKYTQHCIRMADIVIYED